MSHFVRRVHKEDTGKHGNNTRQDLWHEPSIRYHGRDRFGRVSDLKHTDFSEAFAGFACPEGRRNLVAALRFFERLSGVQLLREVESDGILKEFASQHRTAAAPTSSIGMMSHARLPVMLWPQRCPDRSV